MATWITHLRIAENLLACLPGLEAGPFAVGNIAPDSGVPDEKWEKFTPDPTVTHFTGSPPRKNSVEALRQTLEEFLAQPNEKIECGDLHYSYEKEHIEYWLSQIDQPVIDYR